MKTYSFTARFSIGDKIYHATPESPSGVIVDIKYEVSTDIVLYSVSFGHDDYGNYTEVELSRDKVLY